MAATAEELDVFRKTRLSEHTHLTLTGLYNVLEKLKAGAALTAAEERVKADGLVLVLKDLHERIDSLAFRAYGWPDTLSDEEVLVRLVVLNRERAAEEARGIVRWLRPDYQVARFGTAIDRQAVAERDAQAQAGLRLVVTSTKRDFPSRAIEQSASVLAALARSATALDAAAIAATYRQGRRVEGKVSAILQSAVRLGDVWPTRDGRFGLRRAA